MANTRIMIVEDEWAVAEDIKISLQNLGYAISSVTSSGKEAIQKAEEDRPDLVLMDIVLQGEMDGIEAASQIRSCYDIPIVYLTAYADEKILERARITEPFGYIVKPFVNEDLKIAIEIALYKHRVEKERNSLKNFRVHSPRSQHYPAYSPSVRPAKKFEMPKVIGSKL